MYYQVRDIYMPLDESDITVALLGLPNVGKSALFNCLVGQKVAIVFDRPGVTRDCRSLKIQLKGIPYSLNLIDTPGIPAHQQGQFHRNKKISSREKPNLDQIMVTQTLNALQKADLIIFLFDGKNPFSQESLSFFNQVRKFGKLILPVVNKSDCLKGEWKNVNVYSLGCNPLFVSAEHGQGLSDLIQTINEKILLLKGHQVNKNELETVELSQECERETPTHKKEIIENTLNLSIIGRPNVGKSTLINAFLNRPAQIVANIPGVTRDTIDFDWIYQGRRFRLSDTAGIRRRSKIDDILEKVTISKAFNSINFSHVCILVIDARELETTDFGEILQQDLLLASKVIDEGRCVVIALNKWDQVRNKNLLKKKFEKSMQFASQIKDIPVVSISAENKTGLNHLLQRVLDIEKIWNLHIPTSQLNKWLRDITEKNPPATTSLRHSKLKYITQVGVRPLQFVIFGTKIQDVSENYRKFLVNQMKKTFKLQGVPLRLQWRQQENPYNKKSKRKKYRL